jgi:2-methylcitrate dehydratase PrpD
MGVALHDPQVLQLVDRIEVIEDPALSARFPAERLARVQITADGREHDSGIIGPRWGDVAPTEAELREKFHWLAGYVLPEESAGALEAHIWGMDEAEDAATLATFLATAAPD